MLFIIRSVAKVYTCIDLVMEAIYQTTEKERTFFIVDLSRLKQEGDTLVNAMVVYTPEADLKKVSRTMNLRPLRPLGMGQRLAVMLR